ncbi:MAG: hypothetical protein KIT10_06275 [Flavobacteriales bacterium]|nr:hypothetical protein [Flavobacteriales bacterium]
MNIKGMLMDHLGFFAPHQLVNAVFALLVAALLGYLLGRAGTRGTAAESRVLAVWAALGALAVVFVRTNLPMAVAFLAVVLVARGEQRTTIDRLPLLGALLLGAACGAGSAIGAMALGIPFIVLMRWARPAN